MKRGLKQNKLLLSVICFYIQYLCTPLEIENQYSDMVLPYGSYWKSSFLQLWCLSSNYILVLYLFRERVCTLYDKIRIIIT